MGHPILCFRANFPGQSLVGPLEWGDLSSQGPSKPREPIDARREGPSGQRTGRQASRFSQRFFDRKTTNLKGICLWRAGIGGVVFPSRLKTVRKNRNFTACRCNVLSWLEFASERRETGKGNCPP